MNVPSIPKYTKNKRVKSVGGIRSNSNSYKISDAFEEDHDYPHDVLSESELNAPQSHNYKATLPNNLVFSKSIGNEEQFYESDVYPESTELNISRLSKSKSQITTQNTKYNQKDDDAESNKSLPLNIASAKHKQTRSQSLTSKQLASYKLFRSKSSISRSASHRKKRKNTQKRYFEYDSDCTSIYISESDGEGNYFYPQLKRWRQRQNNWCCCKWQCCLEGSSFCACLKFIQKMWSFLMYFKWIIVLLVFLMIITFGNVYAFSDYAFRQSVNDYIEQNLFESDWTFDLLLFSQFTCIIAAILVLINIYLICMFYKMKRMNVSLILKETKHNKQLDRGRKRRQVILMQKQQLNELYEFCEKIWNDFWMNHQNFSFCNKIFHHNLNKMAKLLGGTTHSSDKQNILDEDEEKTKENISFDAMKVLEYIANLRKIYNVMRKYNREIEGLQLKKLQHDIEKEHGMLSMAEFDNFMKKLPRKYQKKFEELRMNQIGNNVSCDKIYMLLTKILDSIDRNQSLSSAGPQSSLEQQNQSGVAITPMTSGYLQYGVDDDFEEMLRDLSRRPRLTTSNMGNDNVFVD